VVPRDRLVVANARLDQGDAAAQSTGPALGGGLVALVGAPVTIAVDALSYLLDAALVSRMAVDEPRPARAAGRSLPREIGEGLRWTYRHRVLGPLALSTHVWFLANGAAFTALSLLALRDLGLSAAVFGLLVAAGGVAALVGSSLAPALGRRTGTGPAVIGSRAVFPVAWALVWLAPVTGTTTAAVLLAAGLALHGAAGSVENAHDTGLWQRITPDHLLGRANATRRSVNRSLGAVGALLGGVAVGLVGERPTLVAVVATYAVSAVVVAASPLRHVRHDDPD
jgi:predicted MFS family arabinose efflux permease